MDAHGNDDLLDMYPYYPGSQGGETSAEAAADLAPSLGRMQRMVTKAIADAGEQGLTADEAAERAGLGRYTVRARTAELRRLKVIVDSKQRRFNDTGKRAIVWVLAEFAPVEEAA
jgi:hypothetical protein